MKVSITEVPPRQVALDVEIEQERLDKALDQAFQRFAGQVNIPGFRRGKAPRQMVERFVGRSRMVEDALDHLVPDIVGEAIGQASITPYGTPRVENVEFEPFRLRAVVPLSPKVELGNYSQGLTIEIDQAAVDATQVDAVIDKLRESHVQWVPVERAVETGDRVGMDVRAMVVHLGRQLFDTKDAEFVVDPSGAEPAPGFSEQLLGLLSEQEKIFDLPLPPEYRDPALSNEVVQFTVTLHWVKTRELPLVDDGFAQQLGDYSDVAAMRAGIESELLQQEKRRILEQTQARALDKLVELSTVEYPPQVVDHQAEHLEQTFGRGIEQQGIKLEQYLKILGKDGGSFRETFRLQAEKQVRRSLVLDAFADAEQVTVAPDEVEQEHQKAAAADQRQPRSDLTDPDVRTRVESLIRERKAVARLVELASGPAAAGDVPAAESEKKIITGAEPAADTVAVAEELAESARLAEA